MLVNSLRVARFLAFRYVRRSNVWSSVLIIFIMVLTFLNLIIVRGILVGLPEGARISYREQYSGDVLLKPLPNRQYIEQSRYVENILENVEGYKDSTSRYVQSGSIEANYKEQRKSNELPDVAAGQVAGILPSREDRVTGISKTIVEGEFLEDDDTDKIMIGYQFIDRYTISAVGDESVRDVYPGDKVLLSINGTKKEYTVKGILKGKVGDNARRIFMNENEMQKLIGRFDYNVDEIAVVIQNQNDAELFRDKLLAAGLGEYATIQTADESQGQFLEDIQSTFEILGSMVGVIGLIVASITVFIVIFIFAMARQKQIGILKGIGISKTAVELSYVFLSIFYAVIGIGIGLFLMYVYIEPYIAANPINFPFSDGLLIAPLNDTFIRSLFIVIATILSGYIPARMIVRRNTINSILGR
jgi:ABC-type lipoprotein release transport system permease subunit